VCLDEHPPFDSRRLCGPIEITRGCPHACAYCQTPRLFGHTVRHRSIPSIVEAAGAYRDVRFMPLPATPLEHASFKPLSQRIVRTLGRLALAGKLTGSWEPLSTFL